jgi:hypothetical protein
VPRLHDQERRPDAHDLRRLAEDRLGPPRVVVVRQLERALGGLDVLESDDASSAFETTFCATTRHVAVLELDAFGGHRGEVVAFADLGETRDGQNVHTPVSRMPACAL